MQGILSGVDILHFTKGGGRLMSLRISKRNRILKTWNTDCVSISEISTRHALRVSVRNLKYEILNLACALIARTVSAFPTEQGRLAICWRECLVLIVRCPECRKDAFYVHRGERTVPAVRWDRPREC